MSDLPDNTLPISIVAYTISSLPIDIVAQTVGNIAIDIAAQSVGNINVNLAASAITLNVNIASQSANIDVNLAASAITLNVNIAASAATVDIDISAQSISVKLVPDWGAINATDINLHGYSSVPNNTPTVLIDYTVPAGKTLLVYDWSAAIGTSDGQIAGSLYRSDVLTTYGRNGGIRGFQQVFNKPKRFDAGWIVRVAVVHQIGSNQDCYATVGGVLI